MEEKQILLNVIQEQAITIANQLIQVKALEAKVSELSSTEEEEETK